MQVAQPSVSLIAPSKIRSKPQKDSLLDSMQARHGTRGTLSPPQRRASDLAGSLFFAPNDQMASAEGSVTQGLKLKRLTIEPDGEAQSFALLGATRR